MFQSIQWISLKYQFLIMIHHYFIKLYRLIHFIVLNLNHLIHFLIVNLIHSIIIQDHYFIINFHSVIHLNHLFKL